MKMKINYILFLLILLMVLPGCQLGNNLLGTKTQSVEEDQVAEPTDEDLYDINSIEITPNATYGELMTEAGVDYAVSQAILEASRDVYDLVKIRVGRFLNLYYSKDSGELVQLMYQIDSEEELFVRKEERVMSDDEQETDDAELSTTSDELIVEVWVAERVAIPYELKEKIVEGTLESSLYQWALDNDVDERVIIDLADAYQWTIDFAMDPRVGDTYKFVYLERYRDDEYVMPGQILAAKYVNDGEEHRIYYFEESSENEGFFDPDGNSVRKELLKAPIQYKYISSGYTTGNRVIMEFGLVGPHRAIDYAAPIGTPIRAVGDGTVTFAGWNSGGYGYLTSIRHNSTYSTNYAHQSKIVVTVGEKVKQGDIIGYVGSTGYSTGPHLHYELVKYGTKINPLTEDLPPGEPIAEENKDRFYQTIEPYKNILD